MAPNCSNQSDPASRIAVVGDRPEAEHSEEKAAEQELNAEHDERGRWDDPAEVGAVGQSLEASVLPVKEGPPEQAQSGKHHENAEHEPPFERERIEDLPQARIGPEQSLSNTEFTSEHRQPEKLRAEEQHHRRHHHRADIEDDSAENHVSEGESGESDRPDEADQNAGKQEKPTRAEEQHETKVAPAVSPAPQVGRSGTSVWIECDGDLGEFQTRQGGLDHHFRGEFHARRAEFHAGVGLLREPAHSAVEIVGGGLEKQSADEGEDRIANPAVLPWHRARRNRPTTGWHPTAHDEIVPLLEHFNKCRNVRKVVAVIGVAHEDPFSLSCFDAAAQGVAISFVRDGNHACALAGGDFARSVGAAVVSDHDLAGDSSRLDAQKGLANAGGEGFCLIEARHDDRKVHEWWW